MSASFNDNPLHVCRLLPHFYNASHETDIITYKEHSSLVCHTPKHSVLNIGGDKIDQICGDGNY